MENDLNQIIIGENTSLCGKIHLACTEGKKITIGNDCLFSSDIVFRTGDSHSLLNVDGQRINPSEDIKIGDHCWLGHRVLINKGVVISDNSTVGTGAVVTKKFDQGNCVIAGVPAKIVKQNTNWCSKRI